MYIFMECEMENDTPGNKYQTMEKVPNKMSKPLRSLEAPSSPPPTGTREENISYLQLCGTVSTQEGLLQNGRLSLSWAFFSLPKLHTLDSKDFKPLIELSFSHLTENQLEMNHFPLSVLINENSLSLLILTMCTL